MRLPSPPVFSPSPFRPTFPYFVSRGIFRRFHRAISVFRRWDRIPEHLHRPIVESRRLNGQPEDKSERERLGDRIEIETKRKAVRGSRSIWERGEERQRGNALTKRKRDTNSACNKYSYYSGVESGYSIGDDSLSASFSKGLIERGGRDTVLFRSSSIRAKQRDRERETIKRQTITTIAERKEIGIEDQRRRRLRRRNVVRVSSSRSFLSSGYKGYKGFRDPR